MPKNENHFSNVYSWIRGFRSEGFPTQYEELKTAAIVDVLELSMVITFVILGISFIAVLPATRGVQRIYLILRICVGLFIGAALLIVNVGQTWEVGSVHSHAAYKPGEPHEINVKVGLYLGLRSLNISLQADPDADPLPKSLRGEKINYNEEFPWGWDQGRFGFGPFAGQLQQGFRAAQRRGLPLPILWVLDYFTLDGEGFRFGRFYRTAGWYTHIAVWAAVPCWLLSMVLLHSVIRHGALMLALTGMLMLLANFLWAVIRNPDPIFIPFDDGSNLETHFGYDYWLNFCNGIFCIILALVIGLLDQFLPDEISKFFGVDPISDYTECLLTTEEYCAEQNQCSLPQAQNLNDMEMGEFDTLPLPVEQPSGNASHDNLHVVMKRRASRIPGAKKSIIRGPRLPPRTRLPPPTDDGQVDYMNVLDNNSSASTSLHRM